LEVIFSPGAGLPSLYSLRSIRPMTILGDAAINAAGDDRGEIEVALYVGLDHAIDQVVRGSVSWSVWFGRSSALGAFVRLESRDDLATAIDVVRQLCTPGLSAHR